MTDSNEIDLRTSFPTLFSNQWPARGLSDAIASVDIDTLCAEYDGLREAAPRRSQAGKKYFVGHTGVPSTKGASNRLEEHTAIALFNMGWRWPRSDGGWFRFIDYQVPLKGRQTDANVGKIDLLGVTDQGRLIVVELKVEGQGGGKSDAPPSALMEGLRYAAMIEADLDAIAEEAEHRFSMKISRLPPIVQVLAPISWWHHWLLDIAAVGNWAQALAKLANKIHAGTNVPVEFVAFDNVEVTYGSNGRAPRLDHIPALHPVQLDETSAIGDLFLAPALHRKALAEYTDTYRKTLWSWANRHRKGQLDGGNREGRPPVLKPDFANMNVLVPPDGSHADEIRAAIPAKNRHRHFGSFRSSQALAQSVFGTTVALNQYEFLKDVSSECGRPAFFTKHKNWAIGFEHDVQTLGEPRPTSIDVMFHGTEQHVAVECKFIEPDFGTCSRPCLRPSDASYKTQRCDGNYRVQAGRKERCPLTTIGVQYWKHLPQVFDWPADHDHEPCDFGAVYQLARNALAAVVTDDGDIDSTRGHALIVYDARNPAFQAGGKADRQWETAVAACLLPGLLRRVSWQRLLTSMATAPELGWLVAAMGEKYGIVPD